MVGDSASFEIVSYTHQKQGEDMALAVVYGFHQCRYLVLGCMDLDRTVAVNHQPLLYVLNYRSLVDIQNRRLQKLANQLS